MTWSLWISLVTGLCACSLTEIAVHPRQEEAERTIWQTYQAQEPLSLAIVWSELDGDDLRYYRGEWLELSPRQPFSRSQLAHGLMIHLRWLETQSLFGEIHLRDQDKKLVELAEDRLRAAGL